ncbi:MAG TPA: pyridoxamine 5'-phosphate oxidase family protein [Ktedonobacteraceae bacterium]|nr:pyridoxamine 5'-phosphate oxidase family protein [Ktedonobacteraceae bacterium]
MTQSLFKNVVTSEETLRELIGTPSERAVRKQLSSLDQHCRTFISSSPFLLVGTVNSAGMQDVSPRGDAPGFVLVMDEKTLIIPERPGNRRLDTLRNILQTSAIGLIFLIPGVEETLRVNGRACLVRDTDLLERLTVQGKQPLIAIGVEVEECFLHCAKAFKRSKLWDTTTWPERKSLPSLGQMLCDQLQLQNTTVRELDETLDKDYKRTLY